MGEADRHRTIVATRNPCFEHTEDLWALGEGALLFIPLLGSRRRGSVLSELQSRLSRGEGYRYTLSGTSRLSSTERAVLRCIARGWEARRIAEELGMCEQSVRNSASRVRSKLELHNDVGLALYYWGLGTRF